MVSGTKKKRSVNSLPRKISVRNMQRSKRKAVPRLKSARPSVPAVVRRYVTRGEIARSEKENLIGAALLFLESLIFETCSQDKLFLAGGATVSKLKKLGMPEKQAVEIMNRILSAAERERKRNIISGMF